MPLCTSPEDIQEEDEDKPDEKTKWRDSQIDKFYHLLEEFDLPLDLISLNGQIVRLLDIPPTGGVRSDVYVGRWNGELVRG